MAVDTANKRFSMMGLGQPVPSVLPIPDGSINSRDRAMLMFLYHRNMLEVTLASGTFTFSGQTISVVYFVQGNERVLTCVPREVVFECQTRGYQLETQDRSVVLDIDQITH